MNISSRVKTIIMEATGNNTISAISMTEREEIAGLYKGITGENLNKWCNACIVKACYSIKKAIDRRQKYCQHCKNDVCTIEKDHDEDNNKHNKTDGKGQKQNGRGSSTHRNRGAARRGSGS